jgi:hypothetical protein
LLKGKVKPAPIALGDWLRIYDERYLKPLAVVQSTLFTVGTWQYWDMFAPNPSDTDWYCDVIIHYKDGSKKTVLYPRMYSLSIPEKYLKERYRKFYERAHDENGTSYVFTPFAYREAYENYTDPNNPPTKVELRRNWSKIPPPGMPPPKQYENYIYFTAEIDPLKLKQMQGSSR